MIITVDLQSETPIYQQIRDQIVVGIATGDLPPGTTLPSARQLATDFGINFHTVNKAYDLLRQEGFVVVTRRRGTVVRPRPAPDLAQLEGWERRARVLLAEARARGLDDAEILERCRRILAALAASAAPDATEGARS